MGPRTKLLIAAGVSVAGGVWWKRKQSRIGICVEAADGGRKVCAGDVPVEQGWNPIADLASWLKSLPSSGTSSSSDPIGGGITWGSQGTKPSEWWDDPPR